MASSNVQGRERSLSWQEKLMDHCRVSQYPQPVYSIVSDRRGGRTAWSSTVTIPTPNSPAQQTVQARYWYDGQYVNQAKEDAAEVALRLLTNNPLHATMHSPVGNGSGGSNPQWSPLQQSSKPVTPQGGNGAVTAWPGGSPPKGTW